MMFGLGTTWGGGILTSYAFFNGSTETINNSRQVTSTTNTDYSAKLRYENGVMSLYFEDELYDSNTVTNVDLSTIYFWHRDYRNTNTVTVSDVIVKPL